MKAQLFAALVAMAGCASTTVPPSVLDAADVRKGEAVQITLGTNPIPVDVVTTTAAAQAKPTTGVPVGVAMDQDEGSPREITPAVREAPPSVTPRPANTGDPCGWCR
jgi:hypothetical protein